VPPSQYEDAKKSPSVNVVEWTGVNSSYRLAHFNLKRPFIAEKKVREALFRAINRQDLLQFEENLAVPQYGFFTQDNKWRSDAVEKYEFDLNRSKQLLQEAGFPVQGGTLRDKDGQPVKLEIVWPTTSQPRGKIATYLQQQWKQLGIEVTVTGLEFNAFVDKYSRQKDFDVAMGTLGGGTPDADVVTSQIKSDGSQNASSYSNPRVDELLEFGKIEQDETKRKAIYDEIQKIVMEDPPNYYMMTLKKVVGFDKKVQGVSPRKGGDILQNNNLQVLDWYLSQ
jgi:peptide/nickel transport system substrate-binding protein